MSKKITPEILRKVGIRNLFGFQWGWNYEKMQGLGYTWTMMPALEALYGDDPELMKRAMKNHLSYFNTTPATSHLIVGANVAIEEELGIESEEVVRGMKTGLMGPFAGVGDTLFVSIYRAVIFSIAANFALDGSAVGLIIPLICGVLVMALRMKFTTIGYEQGQKLATGMAGQLKAITEAASILGLTVIGALGASVVNAKLNFTLQLGDVPLNIQSYLDKIMPALLPLGIIMFSYWLLGKKGMNSTKLIWVLLVLGMILGNLGNFFGLFNLLAVA